jgi:hypothetical protein
MYPALRVVLNAFGYPLGSPGYPPGLEAAWNMIDLGYKHVESGLFDFTPQASRFQREMSRIPRSRRPKTHHRYSKSNFTPEDLLILRR